MQYVVVLKFWPVKAVVGGVSLFFVGAVLFVLCILAAFFRLLISKRFVFWKSVLAIDLMS